jgi:FkbM family methyltransferase
MDVFLNRRYHEYYEQSPLVLVDVGASGGLQPNWRRAQPHLRVIGFEPDQRALAALTSESPPSATYLGTGLYHERTSLDLFLTHDQTASSVLPPNLEFLNRFPEASRFKIVDTVRIDVDTLDHQLEEHDIHDVDFIKLDTQGSELSILRGSQSTLSESVFGLEVEVEFQPMYQGQPLFAEVEQFLTERGFELFDIRPVHWKRTAGQGWGNPRGQLIFGDALFLRSISNVITALDALPDARLRQHKTMKILAVCILYGYLDYALELLMTIPHAFTRQERAGIEAAIRRGQKLHSRLPNFLGRSRLAALLFRLWQVVEPTHHGWASRGRAIANQ